MLGTDAVFLDSDDLKDLRELLVAVRESDCLLLFQSSGVLTRPWCLLEIYHAVLAHVPIITINVRVGCFLAGVHNETTGLNVPPNADTHCPSHLPPLTG